MGAKHSSTKGGSPMDKKFAEDTTKAHNEYRKRHQAPPLSHSKELSAQAQKWADHLAATGSFQHSGATLRGEHLGENIAMKWSSAPDTYTGQEVTDQWYSEVKVHKFGTEPSSLASGHFTQVVWKVSREVGVGKAVTGDGKVIVVANYRPAGNLVGSFAQNVLPPKDGKIELPPEPASQPTRTTTSHFSQRGGAVGDSGGSFSERFQDMQKGMFSGRQTTGGGISSSESRSVRTYTVTEGVGANKVTKTVTEETIIKANGEKIVNKKETITKGESTSSSFPASQLGTDVGRLTLRDQEQQGTGSKEKSKKPFWKSKKSGSSSSDSSPERNSASRDKKAAAAAGKTTCKPQKMTDFHKDCLKAHNTKRALHGSPALSLASDLSEHAQKWAEHLASTDSFEHSPCTIGGKRVGENIACRWSSAGADYTGEQVVDQWYEEIKKHNFQSDGSMGSGHFTQVVWRGSQELGVGKAKTGKGKCIVVCNYRPAGNMRGAYKDNVLPPK
ncbi:uncharacterized protein LOC143289835 isoform X2 [Babylonia areolata]|uniref:uncharacterized protein LOC143289835 isoform X2 n=1 Tax=Babylonia areolata TaxID=304850 RepID=UPI003FD44725